MSNQAGESDMRRRAAWLLAMLAVVAALFVVLFTTLLNGSDGGSSTGKAAPDDTLAPTVSSTHPHTAPTHTESHPAGSPDPTGPTNLPSIGTTDGSTGEPQDPATTTCPSSQPCVLQGDSANMIAAVNEYRTKNGQEAVAGTVSAQAQKCALSNGGAGCSGGWAESQLDKLDGKAAVGKVSKLGKLLDPNLKSFEVGWAYAPDEKQYYIAIIRND